MFSTQEIGQTLRMIEHEHLDIRTVTLGVALRDCGAEEVHRVARRAYDKLSRVAGSLVQTIEGVEQDFAVPIVNKRISVTPVSLVAESGGLDGYVGIARALDRAAGELGIDYLAGYSALVHKGWTPGDRALIDSIPEALNSTSRLCSSVNIGSTRAGIHMDAVRRMGTVIKEAAELSAEQAGVNCARLVVFCNAVEDNPFIAGAMHGVGEGDLTINVGVSGPGVVLAALERLGRSGRDVDLASIAETIKAMAFKVTRAGEMVGREVARRLGEEYRFGVVDLSLAPTPAVGDSVARILEAIGLEHIGAPGTTAALALLTDAVKKGGMMASSQVGGLSGAFIPVMEDEGMAEAVRVGALSIEKLEAMTSICSVGLDMVPVPGDTSAETISALIADEAAIGMMNNKTTASRIIPVPGRKAGEIVDFGGLLGASPIMPVNSFSPNTFIHRRGRIPAPLHSVRN